MARWTGPKHRMCRRLGQSICGLEKCPVQKRPQPPGEHGRRYRRRESDFAVQLKEKQKVRAIYGVLERQFRRYFRDALRARGRTGDELLKLLERRLDNVVYRLGIARTRPQARQLVNHGHVLVDGQKVDIASFRVEPGQKITLRPRARDIVHVQEAVQTAVPPPDFLRFDPERLEGVLLRVPERQEIPEQVNEDLVVDFYSR